MGASLGQPPSRTLGRERGRKVYVSPLVPACVIRREKGTHTMVDECYDRGARKHYSTVIYGRSYILYRNLKLTRRSFVRLTWPKPKYRSTYRTKEQKPKEDPNDIGCSLLLCLELSIRNSNPVSQQCVDQKEVLYPFRSA